jgi:hypothetical protein
MHDVHTAHRKVDEVVDVLAGQHGQVHVHAGQVDVLVLADALAVEAAGGWARVVVRGDGGSAELRCECVCECERVPLGCTCTRPALASAMATLLNTASRRPLSCKPFTAPKHTHTHALTCRARAWRPALRAL